MSWGDSPVPPDPLTLTSGTEALTSAPNRRRQATGLRASGSKPGDAFVDQVDFEYEVSFDVRSTEVERDFDHPSWLDVPVQTLVNVVPCDEGTRR